MKLIYRDFEIADAGFVNDLVKSNMYELAMKHWGEWKDDKHDCRNKKDVHVIVENELGERVGLYAYKLKVDDVFSLEQLHVVPEFQNKGIGSLILAQVLVEAQKFGCVKCVLHVFEDNDAVRFYDRAGFARVEVKNNTIEMHLKL